MKIIGKSTQHTYIAEVSDDEIARMLGFTSAYVAEKRVTALTAGSVVHITPIWDALQFERSRPAELADTAKRLRAEADKIDKINHALSCPITAE